MQYAEDCESLDDAISFLESGAEHGELFQICIVGPDGTVYLERSPTIDISDEVSGILTKLHVPFTDSIATFAMK